MTSIKAVRTAPSQTSPSIDSRGAVMSSVDIFYLGLVLVAFIGFAVVLAYYSHR